MMVAELASKLGYGRRKFLQHIVMADEQLGLAHMHACMCIRESPCPQAPGGKGGGDGVFEEAMKIIWRFSKLLGSMEACHVARGQATLVYKQCRGQAIQ